MTTNTLLLKDGARLDASMITRLEIGNEDVTGTNLYVFLRDEIEPHVLTFKTKREALDFYAELWIQRTPTRPTHPKDVGQA